MVEDEDEEASTFDIYAQYQSLVTGGSVHPTQLCSSTNLSDLLPPEIKSSLQSYLHESIVENPNLSNTQLEAIALARRRNIVDKLGFIVGDGTGVGKSRIFLGYASNHHAFIDPQTKKPPRTLIVSVGNLYNDVKHDAKEIGFKGGICNGTILPRKGAGDISIAESTLFISHNVISTFTPKKLMRWLLEKKKVVTPGREPILIIDEAHRCGNNTKRGIAATELLDACHEAGVHMVVLSATIASNVKQLGLVSRIAGLERSEVHPQHPVDNFHAFSTVLKRLGEAGLESVTMQLRTSGGFCARTLGMAGVEFELVEANMSTVDAERYEAASTLWKDLYEIPNIWTTPTMVSVFHSANLRFFKGLAMLNRLPAVISTAIDALERGESVLLTCLSTDEAAICRSAEADEDAGEETEVERVGDNEAETRLKNGALLDCILQVIAFVKKHVSLDSTLEKISEIEARARSAGFPVVGALDMAKHRLSMAQNNDRSKVVELTGRQKQVKCDFENDPSDKMNWTIVHREETLLAGKQRFQEGSATVSILSAAASTGVSLHDTNGRRRCVIAMELPYSAVAFTQMAGRTHRSGQHSEPKIVMVTCPDLKAESRFAASICSRLTQLGAIAMADRRSGAGNMDFGNAAVMVGQHTNKAAEIVAGRHSIPLGRTPTSIKLLNRCLALPPTRGNAIVDELVAEIELRKTQFADKNVRVKEITVEGSLSERESFDRALPSCIKGRSSVKTYQVDKGVSFDSALSMLDDITAVYKRKIPDSSPSAPIVVATVTHKALILRPNGSKTTLSNDIFNNVYRKISVDDASTRLIWNEWLTNATRDDSRFRIFSILTLPVLDFIANRFVRKIQLVRITDHGETFLGMKLDKNQVEALKAEKAA